jgi:serine protease inhibitor ecotin
MLVLSVGSLLLVNYLLRCIDMIKLIDLLIEQWDTKTMGKPLSQSEINALKKKMDSPEVRKGLKKQIVPPSLSDRETHHIIYVMLKKQRDKNLKKFGGGVQKHWNKMSKADRMHLDRLAKGQGTTGSRPMK